MNRKNMEITNVQDRWQIKYTCAQDEWCADWAVESVHAFLHVNWSSHEIIIPINWYGHLIISTLTIREMNPAPFKLYSMCICCPLGFFSSQGIWSFYLGYSIIKNRICIQLLQIMLNQAKNQTLTWIQKSCIWKTMTQILLMLV
mgnify:CR=1 FL=1